MSFSTKQLSKSTYNLIKTSTTTKRTVFTMGVSIHGTRSGGHHSEPELGHNNMNVDHAPARVALSCQVAHGEFQDRRQRTNQRLHLADNTWKKRKDTKNICHTVNQRPFSPLVSLLYNWVSEVLKCLASWLKFLIHRRRWNHCLHQSELWGPLTVVFVIKQ